MIRPALLLVGVVLLAGCNNLRLGTAAPLPGPDGAPAVPLVERWGRSLDAGFGPAGPIVLSRQTAATREDDRLVIGTREGDVVIVNAETGRIVSRGTFGDSVEGTMAFSPDRRTLYVPVASPGRVTAHDIVSGDGVWRWKTRDLGTPDAGLVQLAGVVVAPLSDGHIVGLDAGDGTVRWTVRPDSTASFRAAPLVHRDRVVAVDDRGVVRLIDPQTGQTDGAVAVGAPVEHAPTVSGTGLLLVPTTRGDLVAVDLADVTVAWRVSLDDGGRVAPRVGPPATRSSVDGSVLVVAGATNGRLVALDGATGAQRWTRDFDAHVNSTPLIRGDHVFVGTTDRRVLALSLTTGETRWEAPVRGRVKSGLAESGGWLYVLTEPRHIVAFGPPMP